MKNLLLLIVVGLLASSPLQAKKIKGEIIFEQDTISVTFHIPIRLVGDQPDYEKLQHRIKYTDGSGKKKVVTPSQAREIRFEYASQVVRLLSRSYKGVGTLVSKNKPLFLQLQVDGEVKLFSYYASRPFAAGISHAPASQPRGGGVHRIKVELIQKGDGELKRPSQLSFQKDMLTYFDDCPPLSEKIANREFRKAHLHAIIQFYNATCSK